jgi:TPR repeat protein
MRCEECAECTYRMALFSLWGLHCRRCSPKAVMLLKLAVQRGSMPARSMVAQLLIDQDHLQALVALNIGSIGADAQEAVGWALMARCTDPYARVTTSIRRARGSLLNFHSQATAELERMAHNDGDVRAMVLTVELRAVASEFAAHQTERAVAWLGHAEVECAVAAKCRDGQSFSGPNPRHALLWFSRSAKQGYAPAMGELVKCYAQGIGTEPDRERSEYWFGEYTRAITSVASVSRGAAPLADPVAAPRLPTSGAALRAPPTATTATASSPLV